MSDSGGAAGFPFPPVDVGEVSAAADTIIEGLSTWCSRLLIVTLDGTLAGWPNLRRDPHPLVAHWGTLHHVQTRLEVRGRGIGRHPGALRLTRNDSRDEVPMPCPRSEATTSRRAGELHCP